MLRPSGDLFSVCLPTAMPTSVPLSRRLESTTGAQLLFRRLLLPSRMAGVGVPSQADLSNVMCRWFIQPAVNVRRGGAVSSSSRPDGSRCSATRTCVAGSRWSKRRTTEAERLEPSAAPAVFRSAAPLPTIVNGGLLERAPALAPAPVQDGVDCVSNVERMRARQAHSLSGGTGCYRDQSTHKAFRSSGNWEAVRATRHGA